MRRAGACGTRPLAVSSTSCTMPRQPEGRCARLNLASEVEHQGLVQNEACGRQSGQLDGALLCCAPIKLVLVISIRYCLCSCHRI